MDFQLVDWMVVVGYMILVFILAVRAGKKYQHSDSTKPDSFAQDQYLAGKSLTFFESLCSVIATEVSALTFLGIPAFAFNSDFSFIQIYFGAIVGRLIIARYFLPKVYDQGLTIYEVMAKDHGLPSGQRMVAICYSLSKILAVGVRLFSGAILVSHFMSVNVYVGLAAVTFATFLYTLIGGLKAVVRTDMLQMGIFVSGGVLAHFLIPETSGQSWSELIGIAHAAGKTSFISLDNPMPFIIGVMGGILFDMSTHGVDQDYAQRLTANASMRHGQIAIFLSSFISISVGLLFLGIGSLLWAYYQTAPFPPEVKTADHIFAHYIVNHFPVGAKGLMVAGVMAATMSTLDSTINALCATVYNDIFPGRKRSDMKFFSYLDTLIITALLFSIAALASKNDGLLLLGLKAQSWTSGSLLGLFMSKVLFKKFFPYRLTAVSVLGAYFFGTLGVYLNTAILEWNWNLNVYWGCALSMIFVKIYSLIRPMKPKTL